MRVSLVVPTYNSAGYIEVTLAEILKSLPEQITEIIVVDDGSSDETYSFLLSKEEVTPSMRLINTDCNRGKALTTILGISTAKENYIFLLDDDLQYKPNNFKSLIERARLMEHFQLVFEYANMKSQNKLYNVCFPDPCCSALANTLDQSKNTNNVSFC